MKFSDQNSANNRVRLWAYRFSVITMLFIFSFFFFFFQMINMNFFYFFSPPPQVTDSKGHILYSKQDAKKGKFAFTTDEYDVFEVCFDNKIVAGMYQSLFFFSSSCLVSGW